MGHQIKVDLTWGVRHAGWLHDRFHVRQSSHLTAYHARRGKPYDGQITKSGASVLYMTLVKKSDKPKRLEHHWLYGVWVGKTEDSEEHIVLTTDGARIVLTTDGARIARTKPAVYRGILGKRIIPMARRYGKCNLCLFFSLRRCSLTWRTGRQNIRTRMRISLRKKIQYQKCLKSICMRMKVKR